MQLTFFWFSFFYLIWWLFIRFKITNTSPSKNEIRLHFLRKCATPTNFRYRLIFLRNKYNQDFYLFFIFYDYLCVTLIIRKIEMWNRNEIIKYIIYPLDMTSRPKTARKEAIVNKAQHKNSASLRVDPLGGSIDGSIMIYVLSFRSTET